MHKVVINTELRTAATPHPPAGGVVQEGGGKIGKVPGRVVQAGGFDFICNNSFLSVKCEDMHRNTGANSVIPYLSCMLYYSIIRKSKH